MGDSAAKANAGMLREFEPLTRLMEVIPKTYEKSIFSRLDKVEWTCVDANDEYIIIGSNIGQLFVYDRNKECLVHKLSTRTGVSIIICVKNCTCQIKDILDASTIQHFRH